MSISAWPILQNSTYKIDCIWSITDGPYIVDCCIIGNVKIDYAEIRPHVTYSTSRVNHRGGRNLGGGWNLYRKYIQNIYNI